MALRSRFWGFSVCRNPGCRFAALSTSSKPAAKPEVHPVENEAVAPEFTNRNPRNLELLSHCLGGMAACPVSILSFSSKMLYQKYLGPQQGFGPKDSGPLFDLHLTCLNIAPGNIILLIITFAF
ncbi:hypothetical protein H8959_000003 [Pygathrix nigripes]